MRTLELQTRYTQAEWVEFHQALLTVNQRRRQAGARRWLRTLALVAFLWGGFSIGVELFHGSGQTENQAAGATVGAYLVLLVGTVFTFYIADKLRARGVTFHFAFMDEGWRYSAGPTDQVRPWTDIKTWVETRTAFHLVYDSQMVGPPSLAQRLWDLLTLPLGRLSQASALRHQAMIPKRILSQDQIKEVRSILTAFTTRDPNLLKLSQPPARQSNLSVARGRLAGEPTRA